MFGSGEISTSGRRIYEWLFSQMDESVRAVVLETPAGFQPNTAHVAGQVAEFLRQRLQNFRPEVTVVPARKRETEYSPDDPAIVAPVLKANVVFLGPGSPSYAVRQLRDSLAWNSLLGRHRLGAHLVFSSAATVAIGAVALPVYEIFKVGEDLHWRDGLNLFGAYGLSLVLVPHWDNKEGGETLDTSRCYMGRARFESLLDLLPDDGLTVVGIDEHTAMAVDVVKGTCSVMGRGGVTLLRKGKETHYSSGESYEMSALGAFCRPRQREGIPETVWNSIESTSRQLEDAVAAEVDGLVLQLVAQRETARVQRDWAAADKFRTEIEALGWQVQDTAEGPQLERI